MDLAVLELNEPIQSITPLSILSDPNMRPDVPIIAAGYPSPGKDMDYGSNFYIKFLETVSEDPKLDDLFTSMFVMACSRFWITSSGIQNQGGVLCLRDIEV